MKWVIEYYTSSDGKCPVNEFIDSLSSESKAKYLFIADLLEEFGLDVKEPYIKDIKGKKKLFEMRIKDKFNIHRILYFLYTGRKIIFLHGFTKKSKRTPAKEIMVAEKRMKDYLIGKE